MTIPKKFKFNMRGLNGNVFAVMGAFRQKALAAKWTEEQVKVVLDAAKATHEYHGVLCTLADGAETPEMFFKQEATA